jgi:hypothetical protein
MRMLLKSMHPSFCSAILSIIFKGVILQEQFEATKWVEKHLLSKSVIKDGNINNAFWLGFLHSPWVPSF